MEIVYKKLSELKPYEKNPRKNDEAVHYVAKSIQEFGFKVPIIIDKKGIIVAGHTRYRASKELGIEKVPCIIADDLTDEQIKAFRLADNKVSEFSSWDYSKLLDELKLISKDMMAEFDIVDVEFCENDEKPELSEEEQREEEKYHYICPNCSKEILESELIICK